MVIKLTLRSTAASAMGLNWWFLWSFESRHTRHTSCWSSWQNSLSLSPWRLQSAPLWPLSCKNVSHRFFNARLVGGSSFDDLLLQTGHSLDILVFQNCCRQSLQTLWLHERTTGSLKMSQHTGQEKSSSEKGFDAIVLLPVDSLLQRVLTQFALTFTHDYSLKIMSVSEQENTTY